MKYSSLGPVSHSSADNVSRLTVPWFTGWRDLPWALLFCAHLTLLCGATAWLLASGRVSVAHFQADYAAPTAVLSSSPLIVLLVSATVLSLVLSLAYLSLLRLAPAHVIRVILYGGALMLFVSTVAALLSGSLYGALGCGLLFALQLLWVWSVQRRIAFSAVMLEVSVRCIQEFPSTLAVPLCGLLAQSLWFVVWLLCYATLSAALSDSRPSVRSRYGGDRMGLDSGQQLLFAALLLSYYWTYMTITYVVHTAVAGVAGVYYFLYPHRTPSHPVLASVRRSLTTSLGSVCLGALVVAAVQTARSLLNLLTRRQEEARERSVLLACALYCAQCLLSLIEGIIQWDRKHTIVTKQRLSPASFLSID